MSVPAAAFLLVMGAPAPVAIDAENVVQAPAQAQVSPVADAQPASPPFVPLPPAQPVYITLPLATPPTAESADADGPPGDEIVVTAREEVPGDPLSEVNAKSYEAIQAADVAIVAPIAGAYEEVVPEPVRDGLKNFLRNLEEPVIAFNYLLQLKPGRAVKSVARFAVNSTLGIAGVVDVAKRKPFNLPYTPNGFANTFACYGVGPGPYLYLPLIGPTTVRDLIGVTLDRAALPAVVGAPLNDPYYALPAATLDSLNDRVEIDGQIKQLRKESTDPYAESRDLYLKQRASEIAAICPKKGQVVDETLPPRPGKGKD